MYLKCSAFPILFQKVTGKFASIVVAFNPYHRVFSKLSAHGAYLVKHLVTSFHEASTQETSTVLMKHLHKKHLLMKHLHKKPLRMKHLHKKHLLMKHLHKKHLRMYETTTHETSTQQKLTKALRKANLKNCTITNVL